MISDHKTTQGAYYGHSLDKDALLQKWIGLLK